MDRLLNWPPADVGEHFTCSRSRRARAHMKCAPTLRFLAALVLSLLVAAPAAAEEVVFWHKYRGAERTALESIINDWNAEHPDTQVVPMAIPNEAFQNRLETTIPRGNGPDLFIASNEKVVTWSRVGLIQPVEPDRGAYHPVTMEGMVVEGQSWGWPTSFKCLSLYVNPALVPEVPRTSDELLAFAREHASDQSWGLAFNAVETYYVVPWLYGYGGGVFDDRGAVALDQPENAAAVEYVMQLAQLGPADPTTALITQLFNQGLVGMVVDGPWLAGELAEDLEYTIETLPTVSETGQPVRPFATIEGIFLAHGAKNPAGAQRFAEHLATTGAIEMAVAGRQSVAHLAAWEDERVASDDFLQAFRAQLDATTPMPTSPDMAMVWEPMNRSLRRVNRGAATGAVAMAEAQTQFEIVTAPPPPEANPMPYGVLMGVLALGGAFWLLRKSKEVEVKGWGHAYLWAGPAFLAIGLLVLLPFVVGSGLAFFSHRDGEYTFVGLANFLNIILARDWPITSPLSFYYTLLVTVVWTVVNVSLHVSIGMGLALILREPWIRIRAFWRVLLILPWAVPNYITALMWKGLFHRQLGAINSFLSFLGAEPVGWFDSFLTAFCANLTTNVWLGFPFMMVITLGALQAIPRDLEEAAMLDGASAIQRFRHVILPLLRPAMLPAVILGIVWTFNQFNIIYLVSAGEPDGSTEILITEAYRWAFTRNYRFGYAAAYTLLIFGTLLIYNFFTKRLQAQD
jgi:arabinogalactan oligomer/maltooligosaccharide transport system permease protein